MSHDRAVPRLQDDRLTLEGLAPRLIVGGAAVGLVALVVSLILARGQEGGLLRLGSSYLVSFAFFLSLSLGALFFVAIQHVTRASWSVVVRRLAELMAANLSTLALLALPVLLLAPRLFPWATGTGHTPAELLAHKAPYLNLPFFYVRWVVYFVVWAGFGLWFWRRSVLQDRTGDPRLTLRMEGRSGLALVLFALTVTLASYDLLMSLDPAWFSTMFGPYYFAGGVVGFHAALTLVTLWLQGRGRLATVVHLEHLHDYGKLMFAFVFFWAYLAFSQYMLIWYANIPEETAWYLRRQENGWQWLALVLLFGHFLLPFAGLLSRFAKRSRGLLGFWAAWIFVMHWLDLYWLVKPEFRPQGPAFDALDLCCFLGVGGLYLAGLALLARDGSLVPTGDPRLHDSLSFENA